MRSWKETLVRQWNQVHVGQWLTNMRFDSYVNAFAVQKVNGASLLNLADHYLASPCIGMRSLHRRRFLNEVTKLKQQKSDSKQIGESKQELRTHVQQLLQELASRKSLICVIVRFLFLPSVVDCVYLCII